MIGLNKKTCSDPFKGFRIGYHYTSYENWVSIRKTGLRKYDMRASRFPELILRGIQKLNGVWIFDEAAVGRDLFGSVIYHMAHKATEAVVKLEVQYKHDDLFVVPSDTDSHCHVKLHHRGDLVNFNYHNDKIAHILKHNVKKHRIKKVCEFNLPDMITEHQARTQQMVAADSALQASR